MPIETELQLNQTYTVTIGATGIGTILDVGPTQSWERWIIEAMQTSVVGSTTQTQLTVYMQGQTRAVEGTYSGNFDNSNTKFDLRQGQRLNLIYTNGTPGAVGTVVITGTRYLRGRRGY
jgi:hypothetical protein